MKDFRKTTTIYTKSLQTVTLKIRQGFIAGPHAKLPAAGTPVDLHEILRAIYQALLCNGGDGQTLVDSPRNRMCYH